MSKKNDIAQQNQLDQVKVKLRDFNLTSLSECDECENEIPPERQAYGGIRLCIECKTLDEIKKSRYITNK